MQLDITKDELYTIIKSAVRDVLKEDKVKHILDSAPYVSDEEMEDIVAIHGDAPGPKEVSRTEVLDL